MGKVRFQWPALYGSWEGLEWCKLLLYSVGTIAYQASTFACFDNFVRDPVHVAARGAWQNTSVSVFSKYVSYSCPWGTPYCLNRHDRLKIWNLKVELELLVRAKLRVAFCEGGNFAANDECLGRPCLANRGYQIRLTMILWVPRGGISMNIVCIYRKNADELTLHTQNAETYISLHYYPLESNRKAGS